jgi:hypothetical protein
MAQVGIFVRLISENRSVNIFGSGWTRCTFNFWTWHWNRNNTVLLSLLCLCSSVDWISKLQRTEIIIINETIKVNCPYSHSERGNWRSFVSLRFSLLRNLFYRLVNNNSDMFGYLDSKKWKWSLECRQAFVCDYL